MAENLEKRPSKGILKNSSSFDQQDAQHHRKSINKETKWDEMNIIATLHPPDKDYGHMKIDEPKTPFNYDEPDTSKELDADALLEKLKNERPPKVMEESDDDEQEEEEDLTPEEKALRKEFEMKRKAHYNEYYAVKLARKLLEEDDNEEDEDKEERVEKVENVVKEETEKCNAGTSGFVNQCLCDEECKCLLAENKNCK